MGGSQTKYDVDGREASRGHQTGDAMEMSDQNDQLEVIKAHELSNQAFNNYTQIWRNTGVICFSFMFLFTSFQSLQALQSSLFISDGMGSTTLAVIYGALILSTFFLPAPALDIFGCKWTLAGAMFCYTLFMFAHFYATWGLLIPAAALLGLAGAPLWTAKCQYLTTMAHDYARKRNTSRDAGTNLFFGVFFLFFQSSSIWGNLISSQVLSLNTNSSISPLTEQDLMKCGRGFCPYQASVSNNTNLDETPKNKLYMLAGIYSACGCLAVILVAVLLQQLPTRPGSLSRCGQKDTCKPRLLAATFLQLRDYRQLLLIPITVFSGLEQGFLNGDFTQAFITCPLGRWWVGYILICYGICDSVCSFTFGRLVVVVGRMPFFILAALINLSLLITFLHYDVTQTSVYQYFIFAGLWGVADAVWQTQINALYGVLFKDSVEGAFSNYRLWESLGFVCSFAYQGYLCLPVKVYILIAVLSLALLCYGVVEFMDRRRAEQAEH